MEAECYSETLVTIKLHGVTLRPAVTFKSLHKHWTTEH